MAKGEIHIGDIGTIYNVPLFDDDLQEANFDPSAATTKKLSFAMPGNSAPLERNATAIQITINGVVTWVLQYTVLSGDAATFHIAAGPVSIEAKLVMPDGRQWTSSRVTTDLLGRKLRVYENL